MPDNDNAAAIKIILNGQLAGASQAIATLIAQGAVPASAIERLIEIDRKWFTDVDEALGLKLAPWEA